MSDADAAGGAIIPRQEWCDWCDAEDVELSHKIDLDRFGFDAWFCSLQCAARWGCAADQASITGVPADD